MAKGGGSTRGSSWRDKQDTLIKEPPEMKTFNLVHGSGDANFGDRMEDWYLPQAIHDNLSEYEKLRSLNDLKKHFASRGIELTTDLDEWEERADEYIELPITAGRKFAVAVDTYRHMFGKDSLKTMKKIILFSDKEVDGQAAYYYNQLKEKDPMAGTVRTASFHMNGYQIFHELAHAYQDSHKLRGEDAVIAAERIVKSAKLNDKQKAYFGARSKDIYAERMADAFGHGFHRGDGSVDRLGFIERVYNLNKKKK